MLVSVGIGPQYKHSIAMLARAASSLGFDETMFWQLEDVETAVRNTSWALVFKQLAQENAQAYPQPRPFCAAFKPLILLHACQKSSDGDYVLWTDASKYVNYQNLGRWGLSIREAIGALTEAGASEGAFGLLACPFDCRRSACMSNGSGGKLSRATLEGFRKYIGGDSRSILREPHVQDSNILMRVSSTNRQHLIDWLGMASESPRAFCHSHPQDQTAWSVLTRYKALPLIYVCASLNLTDTATWNCHREAKTLSAFLRSLQRRQFSVYPAAKVRSVVGCS